jgi:hypothetical protein
MYEYFLVDEKNQMADGLFIIWHIVIAPECTQLDKEERTGRFG